ncbi:hypothetical protein SLS58_003074 [Diplodia intermedia]|uniref:Uncharacterized protein n=1 Tax=Diplodia intermedia TaxID=856260 RepID=A0ABR3TYF6_9PEZI
MEVKLLLARGARVSVADWDEAKLEQQQQHFEAAVKEKRVRFQRVDVTDSKAVDSWIEETAKWGGRDVLDMAVNAAGANGTEAGLQSTLGSEHGLQPTLANTSDARWQMLLGVNLTGMFHCLRSEINNIADGGSIASSEVPQKRREKGTCESIPSRRTHSPDLVLDMLLISNRGAIETRMVLEKDRTDIRTPIQRIGKPEEVAELIAFLLSDNAKFITGSTYSIDGGWAC